MNMRRVICGVLALSLAGGTIHVPLAQAALVGTGEVVAAATLGQAADEARQRLAALLARDDVVAALQGHGVDAAQARARVDSLSDEEVQQLAGQIDQLPAGGDVLGIAVFVFLVLLFTDIMGYTDIFPFVKKTAR
jgi:hypothetical protein